MGTIGQRSSACRFGHLNEFALQVAHVCLGQVLILADEKDRLIPEIFRGVFLMRQEAIQDIIAFSDVNAFF